MLRLASDLYSNCHTGGAVTVRFLLLGNVELVINGKSEPLRSNMVRGVLSSLLMNPNQFVSTKIINKSLWDVEPISAASNLRTYVSELRRTLSKIPGADRLEGRRQHGYRLTITPAEYDLPQFRSAVAEGRRLLGSRQFTDAAEKLSTALGMWRGAAGDDVPQNGTLAPLFQSLNESRCDVVEDHAEASLALGETGVVIAELRRHLAEHPLRERACALLMAALWRNGDSVSAIHAYERLCLALDQQLRIGPQHWLEAFREEIVSPKFRGGYLTQPRQSLLRGTNSTPQIQFSLEPARSSRRNQNVA
jgi:DNA-binding SARP family transcriptional activator